MVLLKKFCMLSECHQSKMVELYEQFNYERERDSDASLRKVPKYALANHMIFNE